MKEVNDFANRLARAMKRIGSSHVYFIFQQAFDKKGLMDWSQVVKKLDRIIELTRGTSNKK